MSWSQNLQLAGARESATFSLASLTCRYSTRERSLQSSQGCYNSTMATASDAVSFAQIQPEMSSAAAPAAISADAISSAEPSQAQINNETPTTTIKRPRAKPRIVLDGTPDEILARNSRAASPAFVDKLIQRAGTHWNRFYSNHARSSTPFFKDRHWTEREWPQLAQLADGESRSSTADEDGDGSDSAQERRRFEKGKGKAVLEVGCGTGAFIYPYVLRGPSLLLCQTELTISPSANRIQPARALPSRSFRRL